MGGSSTINNYSFFWQFNITPPWKLVALATENGWLVQMVQLDGWSIAWGGCCFTFLCRRVPSIRAEHLFLTSADSYSYCSQREEACCELYIAEINVWKGRVDYVSIIQVKKYKQHSIYIPFQGEPHNIPMNTMWAFVQSSVVSLWWFYCIMFNPYLHSLIRTPISFGYIVSYLHTCT